MTAIHDSTSRDTRQTRKEFYDHLVVYLVVNAALCALDLLTGTDKVWFYWVLGGWGIGLAAHALRVFGPSHDPEPVSETPRSSHSPQDDNVTGV